MLLAAAILSAAILAIGWRPWQRGGEPPRSTWSDSLSLGGAVLLAAWPSLSPVDTTCRLGWFVVAAAVAGALQGRFVLPTPLSWAGRFVLSLLLLVTVMAPLARWWPRWQLFAWYASLLVLLPALWSALSGLTRRSAGASLPLSLAVVAAASAAALESADCQLEPVSAGLAAGLCVWAASAGARGRMPLSRGALPVIVVAGAGAPLLGRLYGGMPTGALLLLGLALLAPWAAEAPWMRRRPGRERAVVRVCAAAIPALAAVVVARGS